MKYHTELSESRSKKSKLEIAQEGRRIKKYYEQFLELLARKTDSEKRMQLFGKDPFK